MQTGPGIVLVHGIGVSGRYFKPLAEALDTTHRVLTPDLPGFGSNTRPRPALTIAQQAEALEDVLRRSRLEHPVLVGHSMGSQVVTELAVRNPGLARALVLIGPVGDPEAATVLKYGRRLAHDTLGEPPHLNALVLRDYLRAGPRSFFGSLRHMLAYPTPERLALVAEPVALVRGIRDRVAPLGFLQELADRAPQSEIIEIPDSRHLVQAVQADLVAAICRRYS